METSARHTLIGSFTLAVIAAAFGFVLWLHTTGGVGAEDMYRMRFAGSVAGLRPGSAVLYNGLRVGEVKALRLDPQDPLRVEAVVGLAKGTPLSASTSVVIETQGLMGTPAILLAGGGGAPIPTPGPDGRPGLLDVGMSAGETLSGSALGVLRRIDKLIADNSDQVGNIVAKISTFSDALGRNADRIDSIAEGVDRMVGGKDKRPGFSYDLAAPKSFPALKSPVPARLAVIEPGALIIFDTQRLLQSATPGERAIMAEGQWSDSLPKLLQSKVIESFENAGFLGHVGKSTDAAQPDLQLQLDIRNFEIATGAAPKAVITLSAKLQSADGQGVAAQVFTAEEPVAGSGGKAAATALSTAFGRLITDLVAWVDARPSAG